MIISNSKRFIFVHLHKCAGTNITRTLEPALSWNDIVCGGTALGECVNRHYKRLYSIHKHSRASEIKRVVGEKIWDDYFTFAFVRNPYARAVSLYTFIGRLVEIRSRGLKKFSRYFTRRSGNDFWSWPLTQAYLQSRSFPEFIRLDNFVNSIGSQPLFSTLSDDGNNRLIVDYVGRMEELDRDFSHVLGRIGLSNLSLEKKRTSLGKADYREYYQDEEDYNLVYELFRTDFEAFGYDRAG